MRLLTAGESHGPMVLAVLDGVPAGLAVSPAEIDLDLRRRQLGYGRGARQKIERDEVRITGGVRQGRTTGGPIALQILNRDAVNWERVMSVEPVAEPPDPVTRLRPGQADLAGALKFGHEDVRDVIERASARETAARVAAGAVAKALLRVVATDVLSETRSIGDVTSEPTFDRDAIEASEVRSSDPKASAAMVAAIAAAREAGDTLGGVVAVRASGVVPGLGSFAEWGRRLAGRLAPAHIERSDVCVVPAAGVVAEAMLALVLADALCEKFGNDSVDDICAAVERYRQRLRPIDAR